MAGELPQGPAFSGKLSVSVLGPLDLIATKLGRLDDVDLADVRHVMDVEHLSAAAVREAVAAALVPFQLAETYAANPARLESALAD